MNADVAERVQKALTSELDSNDPGSAIAVVQEAQEGNAAAQYVVGLALESLDPPLMEDALEWYSLAAAKGYTPAEEKLRAFSLCDSDDAS